MNCCNSPPAHFVLFWIIILAEMLNAVERYWFGRGSAVEIQWSSCPCQVVLHQLFYVLSCFPLLINDLVSWMKLFAEGAVLSFKHSLVVYRVVTYCQLVHYTVFGFPEWGLENPTFLCGASVHLSGAVKTPLRVECTMVGKEYGTLVPALLSRDYGTNVMWMSEHT